MDIGSLRRHLKLGPRLSRAWQEMEQITIGAIEGFCIGGGVALAVARIFASWPGTRISACPKSVSA
jgi:enoyl-CoA hydratase/carnithine racemase